MNCLRPKMKISFLLIFFLISFSSICIIINTTKGTNSTFYNSNKNENSEELNVSNNFGETVNQTIEENIAKNVAENVAWHITKRIMYNILGTKYLQLITKELRNST